ncbi:hypothetical protein SETIT_7G328300v2 [Setaria italica]|uniref:Uncharacterized protein n=1 Tax=Setaria italica TaxID=4555 RepID=A0A368S2B5_SETIT|nr:hypothetical protein SETIT_7G328300v2 [Setaria italica]
MKNALVHPSLSLINNIIIMYKKRVLSCVVLKKGQRRRHSRAELEGKISKAEKDMKAPELHLILFMRTSRDERC